jgi:hypothetical protein
MSINEHFKKHIDRSGFPLQIAVAHAVKSSVSNHGYSVIYQEHAWKSGEGASGFLDLVLEDRHSSIVLAIECKRVLDADWMFLQEGGEIKKRRDARGWVTYTNPKSEDFGGWWDMDIAVGAPQSQFCVMPNTDKAVGNLERVASELVAATQALALEDARLRRHSALTETIRLHFSVVVTTARLSVCAVKPDQISLADGTTTEPHFEETPVVMFRKQLSTQDALHETEIPMSPQTISASKEHTVFVVNAESIVDFLVGFDVMNHSIDTFRFNRRRQ